MVNLSGTKDKHTKTRMIGVGGVAELLDCSKKTVIRLCDSGKLMRPVKVGRQNRFILADIERWIQDGCPPCRERKGGGR